MGGRCSCLQASARRQEAHQRKRRQAFAGTRFADEAEQASLTQDEIDSVDHRRTRSEADAQALDVEDLRCGGRPPGGAAGGVTGNGRDYRHCGGTLHSF